MLLTLHPFVSLLAQSSTPLWQQPWFAWTSFNLLVLLLLTLDLLVFNRHAHTISFPQAIRMSLFWIALAAAFNLLLIPWKNPDDALRFTAGYLVELSLSIDNLFVFLMLFSYFGIQPHLQHRVLFWGIIGAVFMRIIFILLGVALINQLHWIMFLFGAFLLFTGIKMAFKSEEEVHPEKNPILKLTKRFLPISHELSGQHFFIRPSKSFSTATTPSSTPLFLQKLLAGWVATPLFVVLLAVETTDVLFAVDSVPAVIGVIRDPNTGLSDPFIAYSSNIFAILGLRAMYFALAGLMQKFHLLHYGLAAILSFVGIKMLLEAADFYQLLPFTLHISTQLSLSIIALILILSITASFLIPPPPAHEKTSSNHG